MRVRSGGQTGADRTGLEVARELGIPTGGIVPRGWRTDEGPDLTLATFGCVESLWVSYRVRTRQNVAQSDGTVWFGDVTSPGARCTTKACADFGKPILYNPLALELVDWIRANQIEELNVAGNRRRTNPAVVEQVRRVLTDALSVILRMEASDRLLDAAEYQPVDLDE